MPRKIISVDKEAKLRLVRAKRDRRESLSALIKRARMSAGKMRCGDLLARASGDLKAAAKGDPRQIAIAAVVSRRTIMQNEWIILKP
jgi:predicted CopG family antitoxin